MRIRFWKDRWLGDTPLSQVCSQQLDSEENDALVCDYWIMDRGWDRVRLGNKLPTVTMLQLASIALNPRSMERDRVSWMKTSGGNFSVKTTYELAVIVSDGGGWDGWKHIWSLRVQQRSKVFLWLLGHEVVLTNHARWRRGLSSGSDCVRCMGEREDNLPMIRERTDSKEVWGHFCSPS